MDYKRLFVELNRDQVARQTVCPIKLLLLSDWEHWLAQQENLIKHQIDSIGFKPESGSYAVLLDKNGDRELVVLLLASSGQFLSVGKLSAQLPPGYYALEEDGWQPAQLTNFTLAWGLGGYKFDYFLASRSESATCAQLLVSNDVDKSKLWALLDSSFWVRDLINMPAEQMYPAQLADEARRLAEEFGARLRVVTGEELVRDFPAVAMVGRGSVRSPCLIDLKSGGDGCYKITLVGKGVCFDAGGLDLKSSTGMLQMKKDMAGAAHALGVAKLVMSLQLPIQLRVIIPAVENLPSGSAVKVRDIIRTRSGITVEVGNTDAEGRLILADALSLAVEDKPDLLIDFATLTGAARVALGMDIAALFSNCDHLAKNLLDQMWQAEEPVWRLPLYKPYLEYLRAPLADLNNTTAESGISGGAITAALFLQQFVGDTPWIHLDFNGDNIRSSAGRPKGGEAICLRGMLAFLDDLVSKRN